MSGFAAVVLAGGAARRMGGTAKPVLPVGGTALLSRVLDAVAHARHRVVVGPATLAPLLPPGALLTSEDPPGGGPVAGVAAGLALLAGTDLPVALLASDLPFFSARTVDTLRAHLAARDGADLAHRDGAVLVDGAGRPQWLAGVWRLTSVTGRLAHLGDPAGRSLRDLFAGLRISHVEVTDRSEPPPWFDCDTEDDLRRAEEWRP